MPKIDYQELILYENIIKRCDLIICIPTFNSYEVTKATIQSFYDQEGVEKDILITGPSGDIEKLKAFYPDINYVLTKDNYGSSGNQLINIFMAKKYNYEFIMLNDNDAMLLNTLGLGKLKSDLLTNPELDLIYGQLVQIQCISRDSTCLQYGDDFFFPFYCVLYKSKVFENDYEFLFEYFIFFDDIVLCNLLKSKVKYACQLEVKIIHPLKYGRFHSHYLALMFVRSLLLYLFREKVSISNKIRTIVAFTPPVLYFFINSLIHLDLDFSFSCFRILISVIFRTEYIVQSSKIYYRFKEVKHTKDCFFEKASFMVNFFPRKYLSFNKGGITAYYIRE